MRCTQTLLLAISLLFLVPADVVAQRGKLIADCIIQLKDARGGQVRLTVMPGTTPAYVLMPKSLRFTLELALDETYLLTFEHPDCVTKELYVDASVTLEQRMNDFDFPLKVVLQHHKEPFTYAGPVGFIYYEHGLTDFSYHTDYAIDIDERFAARMEEMERTGVDPRSAILGYTATTTPPKPIEAEPAAPLSPWSVQAPIVAHVAPMVHRLSKPGAGVVRHELPKLTVLAPGTPAPVLPPASQGTAVPTAVAPGPAEPIEVVDAGVTTATNTAHVVGSLPGTVSWELIVEARRVTTIIRFTEKDGPHTEYRRVMHGSGAVYFFKDGRSISAHSYGQGTDHVREVTVMDVRSASVMLH